MARTPADARRWSADGTDVFLAETSSLTSAGYAAPTALPGWTRRHLVAHVAANADALGNLVHWAATGEVTPMYATPEERVAAIERTARTYGFQVIENLCSHGVGRSLHEAPEHIPGYFDPKDRRLLKEGMVITIEPFLSTRSRVAEETSDGWTLVGAPGNLSAQYEHTMIITRGAPIVVTVH